MRDNFIRKKSFFTGKKLKDKGKYRIFYDDYSFSEKEWIFYSIKVLGLCLGVSYLFYDSWWFLIVSPIFAYFYFKEEKKNCIKRRKESLNLQFKDMLASLRVSMQAGYSIENAVRECRQDLGKVYDKEACIMQELLRICQQMQLQIPLEELFMDLAKRSRLEDIMNFASVFTIAKRMGGNMAKTLEETAVKTGEKIEIKKEIRASLQGKQMEQTIMSFMPAGILLYLRLGSKEFLRGLYHNVPGILLMTLALTLYIFAYLWGRHIVDIEV